MVMVQVLMMAFRTTLSVKMMPAVALIKKSTGGSLFEFSCSGQAGFSLIINHIPSVVINLVFLLLPQAWFGLTAEA